MSNGTMYISLIFICYCLFACGDEQENKSSIKRENNQIRLWKESKSDTSGSEKKKVWREFTALLADNEVHEEVRLWLQDSTLQKIEKSISQNEYFEVGFTLKNSTLLNVDVRHQPNNLNLNLCLEIENQLVGHKPTFKFINDDQGSYSMVLKKRELVDR